jgi:hypothetical protein
MQSIQSILPIVRHLAGARLSPETFCAACAAAGWPKPADDGIGLWEVEHPEQEILLVLDTVTKPATLICALETDEEHDDDDFLKRALRRKFDGSFDKALAALRECFGSPLREGTYEPPYNWRFAHFEGSNSVIALEQSDYDPAMGVQIVLVVQPLPAQPHQTAITAEW